MIPAFEYRPVATADIAVTEHRGARTWYAVSLGDETVTLSPDGLADLGAKIDAALSGIRAAIAGDAETVEALDAVRATVEDLTPATVREIVAELGAGWHPTLTTHLESNLCHPKRDQFICISKDRGWTLFDGDGDDIARGTTIAELRDALCAKATAEQWHAEATC